MMDNPEILVTLSTQQEAGRKRITLKEWTTLTSPRTRSEL
jgi:hypothetical protein